MNFKRVFIGFVILFAAAFAALLPFAYSVARDIRRCHDQFPQDLARFESQLKSGDLAEVYAGSSAELRRATTEQAFISHKESLVPERASHLQSLGDYSAFGCQAGWVDAQGDPLGEICFQFWWEDGQHKLRRVPGILEPSRQGM